jgi:regulator of sigma E protease
MHQTEDGQEYTHYGISMGLQKATFGLKLKTIWNTTLDNMRSVRLSLQMMFSGKVGLSDMAGPVGIVDMMSEAATTAPSWQDALLTLIYFGGFLAVNLGIMNLLPIPALDGGRVIALLLTVAVERITKKKIDPKYEGYIHAAGMILLLGLMAIILFKDIFTVFKG